jgi:hypothetical protein
MAKKDPNFPMQGKGGGMGGKYARKAENLTAKELKAAGAAKAARKRTVSISSTKRITEGALKGKTVGPGGKPLTGSVRLENGSMAVYKNGKRVVKAAPPKPAAKPVSRSSSRSSSRSVPASRPASKPTPNPRPKTKDKAAKPAAKPAASSSLTNSQVPSATRTYSNGAGMAPSRSQTPSHYTGHSVNKPGGPKPKAWHEQGGGGLFGPNSPFKKKATSNGRRDPRGGGKGAGGR